MANEPSLFLVGRNELRGASHRAFDASECAVGARSKAPEAPVGRSSVRGSLVRRLHSGDLMPHARRSCTGAALFVVVVALVAGCDAMDPFASECSSDADCSPGYSCGGLIAASCIPTCEVLECADGYACDEGLFGGASCKPTCAIIECGAGTVCVEGWFGSTSCQPGCKSNDECPAHTYCANTCFIFCGDKAPQCEPGCQDDSECASGEFCQDGSCLVQCSSDSDCGPGRFCSPHLLAVLLPDGGPCSPGERCSCFNCPSGSSSVPACAAVDGGSLDEQ